MARQPSKKYRRQNWVQACYQFAAEHEGRHRHLVIYGRPIRAALAHVTRWASGEPHSYELTLWIDTKRGRRNESFAFAPDGEVLLHVEDVA